MSGFFNDSVFTHDNLVIASHQCEKGFHNMTTRMYFSLSSIVTKSINLCLKCTHFIFLYGDVETCDLLTSLLRFLTMFLTAHGMIPTSWILYGNIPTSQNHHELRWHRRQTQFWMRVASQVHKARKSMP